MKFLCRAAAAAAVSELGLETVLVLEIALESGHGPGWVNGAGFAHVVVWEWKRRSRSRPHPRPS